MKKLQTLLAIAMGGVLLNAGLTASAQPAKPGYATVARVRGEASYSLDKGVHKYPLVQGKYLEPGATIYTGANGEVDVILAKAIQLPQAAWSPRQIALASDAPVRGFVSYTPSVEQNVVRLMPGTTLAIDRLTTVSSGSDTVSDTELDLQKGKIFASVKKLSAAAQYLIKTPTGIAGVRGTQVSISLNADGTIQSVQVYQTHGDEGLVLAVTPVAGGPAQTYVIPAGQMWRPGDLAPVQISPNAMVELGELSDGVRTLLVVVAGVVYDAYQIVADATQEQISTDY